MKKILLLVVTLVITSCSTGTKQNSTRAIASNGKDLSGTLLGVAKYHSTKLLRGNGNHSKKPGHAQVRVPSKRKWRTTRIYMDKLNDGSGAYHVLLLEYVDFLKMSLPFIFSSKVPAVSNVVGYMKKINSRITVYKAFPTDDPNQFEMQHLKVVNDRLEATNYSDASRLILSHEKDLAHPLEGAIITASSHGEPVEILFPKKSSKESHGLQYSLANFAYENVGLESTWRPNFLSGPYLATYGNKKDKVLDLVKEKNGKLSAEFMLNPKKSKTSKRRREKQFTNPKSAFIQGDYNVSKVANGMFIFKSAKPGQKLSQHVEGRIGLFVDIFDASAKGMDVVELILVDSEKPTDFLMYYEHPDNGEGTKK